MPETFLKSSLESIGPLVKKTWMSKLEIYRNSEANFRSQSGLFVTSAKHFTQNTRKGNAQRAYSNRDDRAMRHKNKLEEHEQSDYIIANML